MVAARREICSISNDSSGRNVSSFAGQMQMLEDLAAQAEEWVAGAIARAYKIDGNLAIDSARALRHDHDTIAHVNGLIDVVSDE